MKKIAFFVAVLILICAMPINTFAAENSVKYIFPEQAGELLNEYGFSQLSFDEILSLSPKQVIEYVIKAIKNEIDAPFLLFYLIFLVILITSITSGINGGFLSSELDKSLSAVGILTVCTTVIIPIIACIEEIHQFIDQTGNFINVFTPVLSGVMISGGQVNSAAGYQIVIIFATEFLSLFLSGIILPLILMYLAFATVGRVTAGYRIDTITSSVKSTVNCTLSLIVSLFVALVTIKGIIGTSADSIALRTGKFFIGSFVPAVGSALAEAASTVQNGLGLIKNTTGVFGIISLVLFFIPPLAKIIIYKLTCDISSVIGEMLGADKISGLLKDISAVMGLLMSVILSFSALTILSTSVTLIIGGTN